MASDCYFFPATISKAMAEMERSGFLVSRTEERRKLYHLVPEAWSRLLLPDADRPAWITWPRVFRALERIWLLVNDPELAEKKPDTWRRVADPCARSVPGETFLTFF